MNTMKKKVILLLTIFHSLAAFTQVPVNNFTLKDKLYLQTLQQAATFLKSRPTKYFAFHQTETYTTDEAFYDTVITKFFNKEKMLKNFAINTDVFAVEGKMDIMRHLLNGCDYYLDFVPTDSIYVTPGRYHLISDTLRNADDSMLLNTMEIYFIIDGKKITSLLCWFDVDTNKLLALSPSGLTEEDNNRLISFLRRQKNYFEYPVKRQQ